MSDKIKTNIAIRKLSAQVKLKQVGSHQTKVGAANRTKFNIRRTTALNNRASQDNMDDTKLRKLRMNSCSLE